MREKAYDCMLFDNTEVNETKFRYEAHLSNSNTLPVSGVISLYSTVPDGNSLRVSLVKSTEVSIAPGEEKTLVLGEVEYSKSGTYEYAAFFRTKEFELSRNGEVLITVPTSEGSRLEILNVKVNPELPREDERVTFTVTVSNTWSVSQNVLLNLYIDNNLTDTVSDSIGGNSVKNFTLEWKSATQGEHSYEVRLYEVVGGQGLLIGEKSGKISVIKDLIGKVNMKLECPSRIGLGEDFKCIIHIMNNNSKTIKVQLNNITLQGRVTYEDVDTNYKRSEQLEGVFYLSIFKEVPPYSSRSIQVDLGKVNEEFAFHFGLSDNHHLLSSTTQGYLNTYVIPQTAYWATKYNITLRFDIFDENDDVIFNNKALEASSTLFYYKSPQEKHDTQLKVQRLKNFGEDAIKLIVTIIAISKSGDKLWEIVKNFWG